ncbi:hypothetical protein RFI_15769 [Reticulomyxa filosa]|uniref:Uncharacterized protein n=1 Tax=Reticulomyxa filosa TaxID=46433 RepID=X6N611_RETFI|nr:hypothetical protein RFI_15769 [Reticulomyxa filosa]|eukprot:ETO21436.1 hypothetical protein RFI_15769 [Reticulomyxa filosa]
MTQIRKIDEVVCTLLRLLIHLPLLIRNGSCAKNCPELAKLLNKQEKTEMTEFLWKQAKGNLKLLMKVTNLNEEEICFGLHSLLDDLPATFNQWYPQGFEKIDDANGIYQMETKFNMKYGSYFANKLTFLRLRNKSVIDVKKNQEQERRDLFSEIEETKQLEESYKQEFLPHLFLVTKQVQIEDLIQRFRNDHSLGLKCPLLGSILLANTDLLWNVRYLVDIGAWMRYLYVHYFGKISQAAFQQHSIEKIFQDLEKKKKDPSNKWVTPSQIEIYRQSWNNFKQCWNNLAQKRIQNECQSFILPSLGDKPISPELCVARDSGDGLMIVKIIELLQSVNNEFLEKVLTKQKAIDQPGDHKDDEQKYPNEQEHNPNALLPSSSSSASFAVNKSLFDISDKDIIAIDKDKVMEIIRLWSVPVLEYGCVNGNIDEYLDLEAIENEIFNQFVSNRRILAISTPFFQFSNELGIENSLALIEANNPELKIDLLDDDLWNTFLASTRSPMEGQKALELLSQTISFLHQCVKRIDPLSVVILSFFNIKKK